MQPRTDGKALPRQAVVAADLCASCGICAGACPSSTPFRSAEQLVTGIDMPQQRISALRDTLEHAIGTLRGKAKVVVFGCDAAAGLATPASADTVALPLMCIGMLPPSFVEYALRAGADGVMITGCRDGDCEYRFGNRWTEERLAAAREPHLRRSVAQERVDIFWAGPTDGAALLIELQRFRGALAALVAPSRAAVAPPKRRDVAHG